MSGSAPSKVLHLQPDVLHNYDSQDGIDWNNTQDSNLSKQTQTFVFDQIDFHF